MNKFLLRQSAVIPPLMAGAVFPAGNENAGDEGVNFTEPFTAAVHDVVDATELLGWGMRENSSAN